jgi:anti-anti-sigma regulatory factor
VNVSTTTEHQKVNRMPHSPIDVGTSPDGSIVVRPHGVVGQDEAVELRQLLVHTMRKVRPLRLVVDLEDVSALDPINVGTLAAACVMGDDCRVAVFMDNAAPVIRAQLSAAGVPPQRLR